MKTFTLLLFFLSIPLFISAQTEELTDEVWYLHWVKLNDQTIENPNLLESNSYLWFGVDSFFSETCLSGGVHGNFSILENEISLSNVNTYPGDCEADASILFREAYYEIMLQDSSFSFTINPQEGGLIESIWVNEAGNELYFTNRPFYNSAPTEIDQMSWFLQYVKIDDVIHYTPNNEEVNSVVLQLNGYHFSTGVCAPLDGSFGFLPDTNKFNILEMAEGMLECGPVYGNNQFQNLYHGYFWTNQLEELEYEYTENSDQSKSLVITDSQGNQLVYGDVQLNTSEFSLNSIEIYPNPVKDFLSIENPNLNIDKIQLLDLQGKIVLEQRISSASIKLDLKNLPKGIYILQLKSNHQILQSEKIIKK